MLTLLLFLSTHKNSMVANAIDFFDGKLIELNKKIAKRYFD